MQLWRIDAEKNHTVSSDIQHQRLIGFKKYFEEYHKKQLKEQQQLESDIESKNVSIDQIPSLDLDEIYSCKNCVHIKKKSRWYSCEKKNDQTRYSSKKGLSKQYCGCKMKQVKVKQVQRRLTYENR